MNILFVCTSNKDRSPALETHFRVNHPKHEYRSAGINSWFTKKHGTHHVTSDDIRWADAIIYAEDIHYKYCFERFAHVVMRWNDIRHEILSVGANITNIDEQLAYLTVCAIKLKPLLNSINNQ